MPFSIALQPTQLLLLKAATLPPEAALPHWQAYRRAQGLDHFVPTNPTLLHRVFDAVDWESQRLMPMIYRNLEHTDDRLIPHLRGFYRNTWVKNQQHVVMLQELVQFLHEVDIPSLVLKGVPLSLLYYGNMGVRMMSDLDILVPTHLADEAIQRVQQPPVSRSVSQFETRHRSQLHATHTWDQRGVDMDLHWNLMSQHNYATADEPFWRDRQSLALPNGLTVDTLSDTHHLFHILAHGSPVWYSKDPPLRWITDSLAICRNPNSHIDWSELSAQSHRFRMTLPVQKGLRFLAETFDLALPDEATRWLRTAPTTRTERIYYAVQAHRSEHLWRKTLNYLVYKPLAYYLFRRGKPGPWFGSWLLGQVRMRYDLKNHDLPFPM